jgi:type I restriction enzyme S subunit
MTPSPRSIAARPLIEVLETLETGLRPSGGVQHIASGVPSLGGEHLDETGGFRLSRVRFMPVEFAERLTRGSIRTGDVLVVKDGATTGKVSLVRDNFPLQTAFVNEHVFICRPSQHVDPAYLFYFLFSDRGRTQVLSDFRGAAQGGITRAFAQKVEIPLPPLPEQRSIVASIEQQLSRAYAADSILRTTKNRLRSYAAGVLEAAYGSGRSEELPAGWRWVTMRTLISGGPQNGVYIPKSEYGSGVPILRIDDFQDWSSRSAQEMKRVRLDEGAAKHHALQNGDLVINRVNSPTHLGKCLIVEPRHVPAVFESNMMRMRLEPSIHPRYLELYLRSPSGRRRLTERAKWAVNQASINQQDVLNTKVPLPPSLEAQREIVTGLDAKLVAAWGVVGAIASVELRSRALQRRVLSDAYSVGDRIPKS